MSKVSLLPAANPLTGDETIPLVQNGKTRQAPYSEFAAPIVAAVEAAAEQGNDVLAAVAAAGIAYASIVDGLANTIAGDTFFAVDEGSLSFYENANGASATHLAGLSNVVRSRSALSRMTSGPDRVILIENGIKWGIFNRVATSIAAQVKYDPLQGVYVPFATAPDGTNGGYVRQHDGEIEAEMFGQVGTADDTDVIQAVDEFLRNHDAAFRWKLNRVYKTRGIGDINFRFDYTSKAAALAAIGDLDEYDVIRVYPDESNGNKTSLYRMRAGQLVGPLIYRGLNGKTIIGSEGAAKRVGFQLRAQSPAWMKLMGYSVSDAAVIGVYLNGDNPSPQWGGAQNNPHTEWLAKFEGYGFVWRNNNVRFSGGNALDFYGIVGNFELSGGNNCCNYNMGFGMRVSQMSSLNATRFWFEGNELGDLLFEHIVNTANPQHATKADYADRAQIDFRNIYSENANDNAVVTVRGGGHFAIDMSGIVMQGTGNRIVVHLEDSVDSNGIHDGPCGGIYRLGGLGSGRFLCGSRSKRNTFLRSATRWTNKASGSWSFIDQGRDNVVLYEGKAATAFTPGGNPGNYALNTNSTSFVDHANIGSGTLTVMKGGILNPLLDSHPDQPNFPSFVRCSNMDILTGGQQINTYSLFNANLPANTPATYWVNVDLLAEGHQRVEIALFDTQNGKFYNWDSETWGAEDAFGYYYVLQTDRTTRHHQIAFKNDNVGRNIRLQIKIVGAGTADLFHARVTDLENAAAFAMAFGNYLGTPQGPTSTTAGLPAVATLPPYVTQLFDRTANARKTATPGGYV